MFTNTVNSYSFNIKSLSIADIPIHNAYISIPNADISIPNADLAIP